MVTKLPDIKIQDKKPEPLTVTVKQTETFVPLVEALSVDWSLPENAKKISKMDYSYFLMRGTYLYDHLFLKINLSFLKKYFFNIFSIA